MKTSTRRKFLKKAALTGASVLVAPELLFLDEISHDIPHQNWGEREWEQDFIHMKSIGIDTVIMIRSGYRKFITYPSKHLLSRGCYMPSFDLPDKIKLSLLNSRIL